MCRRVTIVDCVCLYIDLPWFVCPVRYFDTVTNRSRRPADLLSDANNSFLRCGVCVKQPLHKATEDALKLLLLLYSAPVSHFVCPHFIMHKHVLITER